MNDFRKILKRALVTSDRTERACIFPTVLAECSKQVLKRGSGIVWADVAMALLDQCGFKSDRTRYNLWGYPGLFRELNQPPPWIEIIPDDVDGPVPPARKKDLRPLYLHANEASWADLLVRFREHLDERQMVMEKVGVRRPPQIQNFQLDDFKEKLLFTRCLGTENFENLCDAIFEFDEFPPYVGAPDLFVWDSQARVWFFAEVKGPNDGLRQSQADWVRNNWDSIKGRFVLLIVMPNL